MAGEDIRTEASGKLSVRKRNCLRMNRTSETEAGRVTRQPASGSAACRNLGSQTPANPSSPISLARRIEQASHGDRCCTGLDAVLGGLKGEMTGSN